MRPCASFPALPNHAVLRGCEDASILDSYEPERIAFARRFVATTDRAFTGVTGRGAIARRVRLDIVPLLIAVLFQITAIRLGCRSGFRATIQAGDLVVE